MITKDDYALADCAISHLKPEDEELIVKAQRLAEIRYQTEDIKLKSMCEAVTHLIIHRLSKSLNISKNVANVLCCYEL